MPYKHLTDEERSQIAQLKAARHSLREIAKRLGRAASTISRELSRNRYPTDGIYRAFHAGPMYRGRRRRARKRQAERRSAASRDPFCFAHGAGVISAICRFVIVGSLVRMPRLRQLVMIE